MHAPRADEARAALAPLAERMVEALREHARYTVPPNVEQEIRELASRYGRVVVERDGDGLRCTCQDPAARGIRVGEELGLAGGVKTRYLYSMSSRLVNVRLDQERVRKARTLRERGVALSDVVREAIDERFAALRRSESRPDVRTIVRGIFERYPDPSDLPSRDYDVHDRRAARVAILRKLRRVRP